MDRLALFLTLCWLVAAAVFLYMAGWGNDDTLGPVKFLVVFLAVFLPVALIWIGAIALKSARIIRDESVRLQASMDAMRQLYVGQAQMAATTSSPNLERKIDDIAKAQKRAEDTLNVLTTKAPGAAPERVTSTIIAPAPQAPEAQPSLAFASDAPKVEISNQDFIVALNFPETAEDREGFAALRRALADRRASTLIRASQDILTLLSQDGIYMDDLTPDRTHPDLWRKFANGERGPETASIGGIRDRSSLALSASRMKQDTIFRDAAHHFLRSFDVTLGQMAENLNDQELAALTETRTARAFMLLGRVTGIFDR